MGARSPSGEPARSAIPLAHDPGAEGTARIWYDNPSGLGSFRRGTFHPAPEFLALQSAYRFRAHHCTPGEGHEKGLVEGLVGYARRTFLVPFPEVDSFDELNLRLARETAAEERKHRARQTDTVGQRFAAERPLLAPLPVRPFLPCTRHPVRASGQALVAFDGSRYSVPVRHAGAALWLRAYTTTVELWTATTIVARHPRATAKGTLTTDFWHYLPALVRKPDTFANAIPVRRRPSRPKPRPSSTPSRRRTRMTAARPTGPNSRSAPWAPTLSPSAGEQPARPPWPGAT